MNFKNKLVLITGASSGIGQATALQFAKKGANLILVARNKDKLNQTAEELKKLAINKINRINSNNPNQENLDNATHILRVFLVIWISMLFSTHTTLYK